MARKRYFKKKPLLSECQPINDYYCYLPYKMSQDPITLAT